MSKTRIKRLTLSTVVLRQLDLRTAQYALYLAIENEHDRKKKAALQRVENALCSITNWTDVEAIASDSIVGDIKESPVVARARVTMTARNRMTTATPEVKR